MDRCHGCNRPHNFAVLWRCLRILSRVLHRFSKNNTRCCFTYLLCKMKRDDTTMTDIPGDIQKHMLKLLATNNGASDFVRATSSCKEWKEFAEDSEILKIVQFGRTYRFDKSFWSKNGFLVKCANSGNKRASDILARKRKQDILRLFIQRMKARDYRPDLLQSRSELRRTHDFFSYGIS